jgi:hypothetical protein
MSRLLKKPWGARLATPIRGARQSLSAAAIPVRVMLDTDDSSFDYYDSCSGAAGTAERAAITASGKWSTSAVNAERTIAFVGELPAEAVMAASSRDFAAHPISAFSNMAAAPRNLCASIYQADAITAQADIKRLTESFKIVGGQVRRCSSVLRRFNGLHGSLHH